MAFVFVSYVPRLSFGASENLCFVIGHFLDIFNYVCSKFSKATVRSLPCNVNMTLYKRHMPAGCYFANSGSNNVSNAYLLGALRSCL